MLTKTEVFVENWSSLGPAAGICNVEVVLSEDGRYFMEFEDISFVLYSNFKIR
ncbi:MAG: hypothetical protein IPI41_18265 [Flavobacteriales bacterium]|nr:hypothetical protein [Flavobacteriales bacterium]